MVKIKVGDKEIYYSSTLKNNLDIAKRYVAKDWDMVGIVTGIEGVGKSVLAQQVGAYWDPSLCVDRICFTADEFRDCVIKAKKQQCIILDEAHGSLSSRSAMSKINKTLVSMMAEIRQKQLYILMVLPSFWELDRYVAVFRSRFLLECYSHGFERGFFKFYSADKKKRVYMGGKKYYENYVKPDFIGRFCKGYYVDESEYRKKKSDSLRKSFENKEKKKDPITLQRNLLVRFLVKHGMKHAEVGNLLGCARVTITRICSEKDDYSKKQKSVFSDYTFAVD